MNVIDVMDWKGDEWQLLVPPLRWNRPRTELWLLVVLKPTTNDLRHYYEIPVPVFTEWWT